MTGRMIGWEIVVYFLQLLGLFLSCWAVKRHFRKLQHYNGEVVQRESWLVIKFWWQWIICHGLNPKYGCTHWPRVAHPRDMFLMIQLTQLLFLTFFIGYDLVLRTLWHLQAGGWTTSSAPYGFQVAFMFLHIMVGLWAIGKSLSIFAFFVYEDSQPQKEA